MKPQLLKISNPSNTSYNLYLQECPFFPTPWHYHPEFEIVLMLESTGKKYIGSSITDFQPGDLCMIGSYLPHYYKNDIRYTEKDSGLNAKSIVIHFNYDFLGEKFLDIPESAMIKNLLERSKRGIQFGTNISGRLKDKMIDLTQMEGMARLIGLIQILEELGRTKDADYLTTDAIQLRNEVDSNRIKKVLEFVSENFQNDIMLEDVAQLANMSESAFSRYFKKRTRKTFSTFLTEIRIEHACKLLQNDKMSVSEISFDSGFNNLSNFNRQFKTIKKIPPLTYRMKYLE
ncbi:helix-turn-helix domain-containing protein [Emticicia sp. CRIBPO]|jgi:AraC-like DNA-binding protein|uniref:AraC family transcriptional regulator n=1 Tax=Emticicia sp. CRIBPO TaxID=2683258 RepID=UPI0014123E43|nr:AraC family transcriptional regulator [Emticicia sp. CRIBPO]NBA88109.1 helix-turn-helix domain-containing protein [Emticicia sp. CRIBPO]